VVKHECSLKSKEPEDQTQAGLLLPSITLLGTAATVVARKKFWAWFGDWFTATAAETGEARAPKQTDASK